MTGVILTLLTAITVSGLAAWITVGGSGEPVGVPARDREDSDPSSSGDAEQEA